MKVLSLLPSASLISASYKANNIFELLKKRHEEIPQGKMFNPD